MATAKTWLWIIGGFVTLCVLGLVLVAGAGVYFVSHHIAMQKTTSSNALRTFDAARAAFKSTSPLIEVDAMDHPRDLRALADLPTAATKATNLYILAWNPDRDRLVRFTLPFWLLRLGKRKIDFMDDA